MAAFVAVTNLVFLAALAPSLRNLGAITPLPWPMVVLLSLPLVSVAATALLPGFAARAWMAGWWTRRERLGYSTFAAFVGRVHGVLELLEVVGDAVLGSRPQAPGSREDSMLEAHGLTKRYGAFLALDHVDFQVRRGEILGYLGPNGSGKSTTVNTVVGLLEPSAGSVTLDGRSMTADPVAYRRRIGYVPEEPHLYTHLTAIEYLTLVGRLRGMPEPVVAEKVPALLQLLLLWDSRYNTMAVYSKGMRQRVLLAAALMHDPDLLVLDEPFSGLDVTAGLLFRTLLGMFAASGRMVLFSTHRFDIVEQLCSRVVILSRGRIVADHDVAALLQPGAPSLEDVFVQSTGQDDFAPVARQILDVMQLR